MNTTSAETPAPKKKRRLFLLLGGAMLLCCGAIAAITLLGGPAEDSTAAAGAAAQAGQTTNTERDSSPAEDDPAGEQAPPPEQPTATPAPTPTPLPPAPPIEEIVAAFSDMTDAQRNRYNESLQNNRIDEWTGTIYDVDEGEFLGGFTIYVEMVPDNFGPEVHVEVDEAVALTLNKGQEITFSGTIRSVEDFLGPTVFVENATITPAGGDGAAAAPANSEPLEIAPPIDEIVAAFSDMTDAQRNRYNESIKGARVENWEGTIDDVDEGEFFGGFTVYVEMVPGNLGADVHIAVDEETALTLNKGQRIRFSGTVNSVGDFLSATVFVEDPVIEPLD